jgi:hypothetical protein
MNMIQSLRDKGLVSAKTMLPMVGLDPEVEKSNLEEERKSIFNPEYNPDEDPNANQETPELAEEQVELPVDSRTTIPKEVE